jgi:hypothetical protein
MTVQRDLLSGTPDDVAGQLEKLSAGLALHEYTAGTRLRALAVDLTKRPGLRVSVVTYENESQELEVRLSGGLRCDPIVIDRDQVGDQCQITWDQWLAISTGTEIEKAADMISSMLEICVKREQGREVH